MRPAFTPALTWAVPLVLLLAGCMPDPFGRPYAVYGNTPPDTLRGQCERAAFDDPAVKEQLAVSTGSVTYNPGDAMSRLAEAKRQAVQRCMRQRGGPLQGGGVELPRAN